MATYAVGDLQGCLTPLRCLLRAVSFNPEKDRLWLAGDLINRGPESLATLRFLKDLGNSVTAVLGNHDLHLLAVAYTHRSQNFSDTLDEILDAPDREQLLTWLRFQPLVHYDPILDYAMVHAGIPPQWTLKQALKRAAKVEKALQGKAYVRYLSNMYGNTPSKWHKDLDKYERLRVTTNYFTRMRFCDDKGNLELQSKSSPLNPPNGYAPWFVHPKRKTRDQKIIFGHWAALEGKVALPNLYALDTGCVWGSTLTMMRLEDETFYQCDCSPFS